MLHKVFKYIKEHELCTANQISEDLCIDFFEVLRTVNELGDRGYLKITPIPLSETNDISTRYSVTKKEFVDDSEFCVCKKIRSVSSDTEASEFGYWDTCCICGKHIEDGFHYYDHYDGEDHDDIDF